MNFLNTSLYHNIISTRDSIMSRLDTVEDIEGGILEWSGSVNSKLNPLDEANLISRCGTLETTVSGIQSSINGYGTRIGSLETWRSNRSSAIPNQTNMSVSTTIGTAVITLGLNAPTASSIETNINAVKTEINTVKSAINSILSALRSREIIVA